ncbi:hypothetical protein F5Y10DRAFT_211799 [Nemania abortiva]|nr:hypothetical protein F5Y10DRAFT_211799 [Nemania abortiva]
MSESTPLTLDMGLEDESKDNGTKRSARLEKTIFNVRPRNSLVVSIVLNLVFSIISVVLLITWKHEYTCNNGETATESYHSPFDPPGINEEVLLPIQYGWEYYADTVGDMEIVDRNWDALNPDIGWISMPRAELSRWGFRAGADDPSNPSMGVHTLRGYHSMHCLKIIRQSMLQLARGEKLEVKFGHSMHCLGSLLRDVICSADDSLPLNVPGRDDGTYQYVRKCRNWEALRHWAGARTSCMVTSKDGTLDQELQYLENCTRTDGVLLPTLAKNTMK